MRTLLILLFFLPPHIHSAHGSGETSRHRYADNLNSWIMYFGEIRIHEKVGIHLEAQWRRSGPLKNPQQVLLRTGVNFHLQPAIMLTGGYCFVHTSPYGAFPSPAPFPEHRFWEQLQLKNTFGKVEWTGRLRIEQRFSQLPVGDLETNVFEPGDAVYTNRFRLMNRVTLPLKGKEILDYTPYLTLYDEIFINSGRSVEYNFLDQNRAYLAIGYKLPKVGRLELGYLEQTIFKPDGIRIERNHTLQLAIVSGIDLRKPPR